MSETTRIIVHKEKLSSRVIKRLTDAGFIPIQADDPSGVRVLTSEPALISGDAILVAALKGLKKGRESASTTGALDEFLSQLLISAAKAKEGEVR